MLPIMIVCLFKTRDVASVCRLNLNRKPTPKANGNELTPLNAIDTVVNRANCCAVMLCSIRKIKNEIRIVRQIRVRFIRPPPHLNLAV